MKYEEVGKRYQKDFWREDKQYRFFFMSHAPAPDYPLYKEHLSSSVFTFEDEEQIREQFFYPFLKKDAWLMDVGAGFGSYTLPALAFGMKVLAFSPEAEYLALNANLELNKFTCTLSPRGLYDKQGWFDPATNTFSETKDKESMIGVSPFYEYNHRTYHYVKIDVEGAELPVLKGMEMTIKRDKPYILVENHNFIDKSMEQQIITYMESLGLGYKYQTMPYNGISFSLFFV